MHAVPPMQSVCCVVCWEGGVRDPPHGLQPAVRMPGRGQTPQAPTHPELRMVDALQQLLQLRVQGGLFTFYLNFPVMCAAHEINWAAPAGIEPFRAMLPRPVPVRQAHCP